MPIVYYFTPPNLSLSSPLSYRNFRLSPTTQNCRNRRHWMLPDLLDSLRSYFPFKWVQSAITYLGTQIPANLSHNPAPNFTPFLCKIRQDFEFRGKFTLVVQLIQCLLLTLPVAIPWNDLNILCTEFNKFIWMGDLPISYSYLNQRQALPSLTHF